MMRSGAALLAAIAVTSVAASAWADDAVYLKDNNVVRGVITEIIPGDHVSVTLPTGQTARVTWSFVARVDRGGVEQPIAAVPAPSSQASVVLHIDGEGELNLETRVDKKWVTVCSAPCDQLVPVEPTYRIAGRGVRGSRTFRLVGRPGERVVLVVEPGSTGAFVGGIVMMGVGGVSVLTGLLLVLVGTVAQETHLKEGDSLELAGWITVAGGAASLLGGVLLLTGAGKTSVEQSGNGTRLQGDLWKRTPTWASSRMPSMPFMGIPLVTHSF